jgi:hypothetical protein
LRSADHTCDRRRHDVDQIRQIVQQLLRLGTVAHAELRVDAREVMLHRLHTETEFFCDFPIGETGGHGRHDLELAGGEAGLRIVARGGPRSQRVHQLRHALASHPILAGHHGADRVDQQLRRGFLHHEAARAKLQRLDDFVALDARCENDCARRQRFVVQLAQYLEAWPARHREVEQQNIRLDAPGDVDGFVAIPGFSDHFEALFGLEQLAESVAENRVIVGDDYPNGLIHSLIAATTLRLARPGRCWLHGQRAADGSRPLLDGLCPQCPLWFKDLRK